MNFAGTQAFARLSLYGHRIAVEDRIEFGHDPFGQASKSDHPF